MAINDVAGKGCSVFMYEIFFVNFWVIILCPSSYIRPKT